MKEHDSSSTFLCKILLLKMRYPAFIHVFQTGCPVMIVLKSQFITEIVIVTVRNEVAKVMFFTGICLSTGGWGCLPQCMLGYHPARSRHPPSRPPGADTPHPPRADTPREQTPPPREQTPPPPPRDTATAADGTHPAGMHSCKCVFRFFYLTEKWQSCIYYKS